MSRSMSQAGPTGTAPRWAGDYLDRNALLPGGSKLNPAAFNVAGGTNAVVSAATAVGAVAIPVAAIAAAIPNGTVLDFGGAKFARLTAPAAAGAVSLTVAPLATALAVGDTATYSPAGARKFVPSGTPVGRTFAERDASAGFGPAVATDDEIFLTAFDVTDALDINDVELYRHGRVVKENRLPAVPAADVLAIIRDLYTCVIGSE